MPPEAEDATQVKLLMRALSRRVYNCAAICLVLGAPVIFLASSLESRWAGVSILGVLVIAPMVCGYLCLRCMAYGAKRTL